MINFPHNTRDLITAFPEAIELESEDFDRAKETSDRVIGEARQWQRYIAALAVSALEKWLKVRLRDKTISSNNCSLFQAKYINLIDVATPIQIGDFRLCAIAAERFTDEVVTIPKAAIELSEFAAHFYIAVEVLEEEEEAIVRGILRRDRLLAYCQSQPQNAEWNYEIPLDEFDTQIDRLFYDCRYLDPQEIPLPSPAPIPHWTREQLGELLQALQSAEPEQWRHWSWERGQVAIRYPELLDVDMAKLPPESLASLETLLGYLHQPPLIRESVRLSHWLKRSFEESWHQLDDIFAIGLVKARTLTTEEIRTRDTIAGDGKIMTPDRIAAVIDLLQPDRPEDMRRKAAAVLGEIGAGFPEAVEALTQLLHSTEAKETRWEAALSLGKVAPDHPEAGIKRARLIDLGVQLSGYQVALIVAIVPKDDGRLGVWLEVQPTGELAVLPPQLKLSVLSPSGKVRMEAESRTDAEGEGKDIAIAQHFSIGLGKGFQVRVSLGDASITESFLT